MQLSSNGVEFIHGFETCGLTAYPDPGSKDGKPWTIGWGHTGPEVVKGLKWTQEQADQAFLKDTASTVAGVNLLVTTPLTQGQFDAIVSFAYNVGLDIDADTIAEGLGDSTLLRKLNSGDYAGARAEFAKWNKNDGKVMLGLRRRRYGEQLLFDGLPAKQALKLAWELK